MERVYFHHEVDIINFLKDYCREKGARMYTWHNHVANLSYDQSSLIEERVNLAVWGR